MCRKNQPQQRLFDLLQLEHYESFRVFDGSTPTGTARLALAEHAPIQQRGAWRKYCVVFHVTNGSKRPL